MREVFSQSRPRLTWVALFLFALGIRVTVLVATRHARPVNDSLDYQRLAVLVARGHGFGKSLLAAGGGPTAFRAPLYPWVLGAVYRVVGVHLNVARLLGALLGAASVVLLALLADRLFGRRVAVVAGALAAIYPPFVESSNLLLTEVVFVPLELLTLLLALRTGRALDEVARSRRDRPFEPAALGWATLAGAAIGAAALSKAVGALLGLVAIGLTWRGRGLWRQWLLLTVAMTLAAGVVVGPWLIRNEVQVDHGTLMTDEDAFALAGTYNDVARTDRYPGAWVVPLYVPQYASLFHDKALTEGRLAERLRSSALHYAGGHPGYVVEAFGLNFLRTFELTGFPFSRVAQQGSGVGRRASDIATVSFWIVGAAAVAGVVAPKARRLASRGSIWFWVCPVFFCLPAAAFDGVPRYRLPIDPFVILLAALAVASIGRNPSGEAQDCEPEAGFEPAT